MNVLVVGLEPYSMVSNSYVLLVDGCRLSMRTSLNYTKKNGDFLGAQIRLQYRYKSIKETHMTPNEISILRRCVLELEVDEMAKLLSVDIRCVAKWELGEVKPNGTALAVMIGLKEYFDKFPGSYRKAEIKRWLPIGGIAYILIRLLENK